jgi:tetratricopeptide (TPR) repeat protein
MKKKTSILSTAVLLALGASVMSLPTHFAFAQTPAAAKPAEQVTKALVNQVREIQELANAKKFPQALEKIEAIDKIPNKSVYDIHVITQVKVFIYKNNGDTENLIKSIEVMLQSPFVKPDDKLTFTRAVGSLYDNQKNSEKAREWWTKALALKEDASLRESIALSHYFDKNYAEAAKLTQAIVDADIAASKTPKNDHLKILATRSWTTTQS